MTIAHAVLVAIAAAAPPRTIDNRQVADVAVVAHFEVDAETPVDGGAWAVDVEVGDAALDDLGEDLAGALVGSDADFWFVARVQVLPDDRGQVGGLDLVEGVALFFVRVGQRNAPRVAVWHGGFDGFVEEVVHDAVLGLE